MNVEEKLELKERYPQSKVRSFCISRPTTKEYFCTQQMKPSEELGGVSNEQKKIKYKIQIKSLERRNKTHFEKEFSKLQRMNPQAPGFRNST
jgi:ATP-dependent Lon protease